jgi:hypothetical protein
MMAKDSVKKRLAGEEKECLLLSLRTINSRIRFYHLQIQLPVANGVQTNGEYYYWY